MATDEEDDTAMNRAAQQNAVNAQRLAAMQVVYDPFQNRVKKTYEDRLPQGLAYPPPLSQRNVSANAPDIGATPIRAAGSFESGDQIGSVDIIPVEQDAFRRAAERFRQAAIPSGGRKEGAATKVPEAIITDVVKLPSRIGGAVAQYEQTGEYNPAPIMEGALMATGIGAPFAKVGALGSAGGKPIRAYHGSPHDFDKFDISKIGTGEGAQTYGNGLYFAENEKVARKYRDDLANMNFHVSDLPELQQAAMARLYSNNFDAKMAAKEIDDLVGQAKSYGFTQKNIEDFYKEKDLILSGWQPPRGRMYEVNINASPDQFLDWDRTLLEQPERIREAIAPLTNPIGGRGADRGEFIYGHLGREEMRRTIPPEKLVGIFPPSMRENVKENNVSAAARTLREAGIPGIKYLDQGSRVQDLPRNRPTGWEVGWNTSNAKTFSRDLYGGDQQAYDAALKYVDELKQQGTSNYVVFDDKLIDILKKYGFAPGAAIPPATAELLRQMASSPTDEARSNHATNKKQLHEMESQ